MVVDVDIRNYEIAESLLVGFPWSHFMMAGVQVGRWMDFFE